MMVVMIVVVAVAQGGGRLGLLRLVFKGLAEVEQTDIARPSHHLGQRG
jgi:hypothetical protein